MRCVVGCVSAPRSRTTRPPGEGGAPQPPLGDPQARIHVAPVGFEVERIVQPVVEGRADRVYLITRSGGRDAAAPFLEEVLRRLHSCGWPLDIRVVRTDIWDVLEALHVYRSIFRQELRLDRHAEGVIPLRVNVSTGTKILAIAGTLACMLWKGDPYYVQVSRTWYTGLQPRVQEVNDVVTRIEPVSVYELRAPSTEMVQVMEALQARGGSIRKKELIQVLGLDRPGPEGGKPPSPQAQHSRLRSRLTPLEKRWGFIQTSELGGMRGRVRLTKQGELALALFSSGTGRGRAKSEGPEGRGEA
jgi:hypothetical protein